MNTHKKQTAVAWLAQKIREDRVLSALSQVEMDAAIAEAIEMERRQIEEVYRTGVEEDVYNTPLKTGEQYYAETYGSD